MVASAITAMMRIRSPSASELCQIQSEPTQGRKMIQSMTSATRGMVAIQCWTCPKVLGVKIHSTAKAIQRAGTGKPRKNMRSSRLAGRFGD